MKYRSDFVTNSSSTSFASAGTDSLIALILSLISMCKDQELDGEYTLYKSVMPEGVKKISAMDKEPVWVYAQAYRRTEKGDEYDAEATQAISFNVTKGGLFVGIAAYEMVDDWMAACLVVSSPEDVKAKAPDKIEVKAILNIDKKKYSARYSFDFEAEPMLSIKPDKCEFLTKTEEKREMKVNITNPGPDNWNMEVEGDSWADKICSYSLEEVSEQQTQATLVITENDTEELTGTSKDQYSKGRITVTATQGDKKITDYIDAYVWREGLYLAKEMNYDAETGDILIKADQAEDGTMKKTVFDMRYMRWNDETKKLSCETAIFTDGIEFEDPDTEEDDTDALLEKNKPTLNYIGERTSNLPSGKFEISMDKPIPGKTGERYRFNILATYDDGEQIFESKIPFAIIPATMTEGNSAWQAEYDYCKKIINTYLPEDKREEKIRGLEENKDYMGVAELKAYRKECWDKAQDIIFKQRDSYLADAAWYDNALYAAEWVQWLNDRAFNMVMSSLSGPVGALVATQVKELIQDAIGKIVTAKATDSWTDIATDLAWSRIQSTVGGGIDAKYFGDPEVSKKWLATFLIYKWIWHWYFDKEGEVRKGCLEGMKAACWDLAGTGLEEKLKPFVGSMAEKGGFSKNEKMDEYVQSLYKSVRALMDGVEIHIS